MGTPDVLRHKDEVLRAHCEAVGRDQAEIERTAGCKPIIRDTAEEARRVWEAQMAHNRTPMSTVEDDDTFWVGTPEQVAAEMRSRAELGFNTFIAEMAAPYDVGDARALDRRGEAHGGRKVSSGGTQTA